GLNQDSHSVFIEMEPAGRVLLTLTLQLSWVCSGQSKKLIPRLHVLPI
ncbi:unnamed protein product, partial [Allacma fusca]